MKLTNTLSRKKEEFEPIHAGKVGMYSCGPTVYSPATIGNFRAVLTADLIKRALIFNGYEVKHVMNITDVGHLVGDGDVGEDKMLVAMRNEGKTAWEIAEVYTNLFLRDMERLNIETPNVMPKATDHIAEQIEYIQDLEKNGFTYATSDGIYFDTSKLADYGRLSGQKSEDKEAGARVEVNTEKRNPEDFALWKFSPKDHKRDMEWNSPWGIGFPGWHIECSAMSEKYLDTPFDIHTGGEDLAMVHHPNEIAQTEGARGHQPVNYWVHNAFVQVNGGKMSKSLGNAYTIDDLIQKGFDPLAFRYFVLQANYSSPQNFTLEGLPASQNAVNNLRDRLRLLPEPTEFDLPATREFREAIEDDVNAPEALAVMFKVLDNPELEPGVKSATMVKFDEFFGLNLDDYVAQEVVVPIEIKQMLNERQLAREAKDWRFSDELRDKIAELGFVVEDGPRGQVIKEKH